MIILDKRLEKRERESNPIRVGFIGAGVMARATLNLIEKFIPGMKVVAVSNRNPAKAIDIYRLAGIGAVEHVKSVSDLDRVISSGSYAVVDDYRLLCQSNQIDVLLEITGTVAFGAEVLFEAFKNHKSVVTFNAELDSTLAPILSVYADNAGVVYSGSDGDQPGVTMNLYRYVKSIGLTPLLCGNVKGLHDPYRNPTTQEAFAKSWDISAINATCFADGTKLCMEQTCVANATGMKVAKRGMLGYEHRGHIDEMTGMYDIDMLKSHGGIIEYALGAKPGPGVYVYASCDDPVNKHHLKYLKMGDGPLYSFYTPYHLCMFDIPNSLGRAVEFGDYVMRPLAGPVVEVVAIAKKDLKAGDELDGPGGYAVYGECENSDVVQKEKLLPIGLASNVRLTRDIPRDQAIGFGDIEYDTNSLVFKLYAEQSEKFRV